MAFQISPISPTHDRCGFDFAGPTSYSYLVARGQRNRRAIGGGTGPVSPGKLDASTLSYIYRLRVQHEKVVLEQLPLGLINQGTGKHRLCVRKKPWFHGGGKTFRQLYRVVYCILHS